jgi:hypothetical protein
MAKLKRRPNKYEEIKQIGPKRAERLRQELGPYEDFKNNTSVAKKNKIARVVSGSRRNLPKFAQNLLDAGGTEREARKVVDSDLLESEGRSDKSKTKMKRRNKTEDRADLGFETQERDDVALGAAFDIFTAKFEDQFDAPAADLGRFAREQQEPDDRATIQPIVGAGTSRVTFASGALLEDFKQEVKRSTQNTDRASASPGEIADSFTGFVDENFGFNVMASGEEVDRRDQRQAEEFHSERSSMSRRVDNNRAAKTTSEFEEWADDPDEFDFPGVDTPEANDGDFNLL